jgi:hypothetical protein
MEAFLTSFNNMSVNKDTNEVYIDDTYNNDMIFNKELLIKTLMEENGITYNESLAICIENDIY